MPKEWTPTEDRKLAELYADPWTSPEDLQKAFPHRTENAIRLRASRTGLKRPVPDLEQMQLLPEWVRRALT